MLLQRLLAGLVDLRLARKPRKGSAGKRLPVGASQSAPASGLESAVAAADPAGDPGLAGTATGAAAAAAARSAGRGFSTSP